MENNFINSANQSLPNSTPAPSSIPISNPNPIPITPTSEPISNPIATSSPALEPASVSDPTATPGSVKSPKQSSPKLKLYLIIVLAIILVGAGVIVAVIMLNNNNASTDNPDVSQTENSEKTEEQQKQEFTAISNYTAISSQITEKFSRENPEDAQAILDAYAAEIATAEDPLLKAMLCLDYYQIMMTAKPTDEVRDEVLDGLIAADKIIATADSARAVVGAAKYYGNTDIVKYYSDIVNERSPSFTQNDGEEVIEAEEIKVEETEEVEETP